MKKGIWEKIIVVLMVVTMFATMTGCEKMTGIHETANEKDIEKTSTKDMVYDGETLKVEGLVGDPSSCFVKDGKLYIQTTEWKEGLSEDDNQLLDEKALDETEQTDKESLDNETEIEDDEYIDNSVIIHLYVINIDGSDLKEIALNLPAGEEFYYFLVDDEGNITYISYSYNVRTREIDCNLIKRGSNGKEIKRENLKKALNLKEEPNIGMYVQDKKGNLVMIGGNTIYVMDSDFKSVKELKYDNNTERISSLSTTKDGKVICGINIYKDESSSAEVREIDTEGKKWGETFKLNLRHFDGSDSLMSGTDEYDFYYKDDSGIYGYQAIERKETKLMDYTASRITSQYVYGIQSIGDGKFIDIVENYGNEDGRYSIVVYEKIDPSTIQDKIVVTLAGQCVGDEIKKAIVQFNKENENYQIKYKDYGNEDDLYAKMNADIIAGNTPDIIVLLDDDASYYASKGFLEDLTPYFEKDTQIKETDLIPTVLDAMKVDDKLYYVAPSMNVYSLETRTSDVGKRMGWTFDEFKNFISKKGDDVNLFYSNNKSDILYSLLDGVLSDFVDWSTGECNFDGQDFKDVLQICNENGVNQEVDWSEDMQLHENLFREGKVLFRECSVDVEEIQVAKQLFGEDVTYIGYPDHDKQGSYLSFTNQVGIYSKSNVKDGAWQFVRTLMSKEYQGKTMDSSYIPTRQDCFDLSVEAAMATKEYTNILGCKISPREGEVIYNNTSIKRSPLTQEEADQYVNIINSTKKKVTDDWELIEMIQEESKPYFAGERSLDETTEIIQNRVKTYVNENR